MKNKTKYLVAILLMLISFLLIGATKVNAKTVTVENEEELINASKGIDSEINEIKLAKDITLTKFLNFYVVNDITFDLSGQTLDIGSYGLSFNYGQSDYDESNNDYYYNFNSKLTIKDSSSSKTGKILSRENIFFNYYDTNHDEEIKKFGLTIDGGYYEMLSSRPNFFEFFSRDYYTNGKNLTVDVNIKDAVFKLNDGMYLFGTISNSDSDIKLNFNFESLKVLGLTSKLGSLKLGEMKLDEVIDPNSKAYFQKLPYTTGAPVLEEADRNTLVRNFYATGGENPYIIIKKVKGFEINNVEINETYKETPSLNGISIKNVSGNDLQIQNVTVNSADFTVEGPSTSPTVSAGATNTDFKVKAKAGLDVGTYTATITVTDMGGKTYTATVTLKVEPKQLTGLGISGLNSTWVYGETKTPSATGVTGLGAGDYEITYSKKGDSGNYVNIGNKMPTLVGEYKATLSIINPNYTASEAYVNFEITPITTEVKVKSYDDTFTYDGNPKMPTGTISVNVGTVNVSDLEVKYQGTGTTSYNSATAPTNAGTYTVTYKVPDTNANYTGTFSVAFTIKKAILEKVTLVKDTYEYTGDEIVSQDSNFDLNKMNFSGDIKATNVGNYSITVSLKDKDNYEWKDGTTTDLVLNWSITQATPDYTVPTGLTSVKGKVLADVALPAGFTWNTPATVLTVGTNTYKATFTPVDTTNYKTITDIDIEVNVKNTFDVITSVPSGNGTITPSKIDVIEGSKVKITFTPNTGYMIDKVLVNGIEKTATGNEIEITVDEEKTVEVSYKKIPFTITVEEVTGATVNPDGTVTVSYGDNKDFTITANTGYKLVKVLVNDVEKALDGNTLKLKNITSNMEIKVVVEKIEYKVIEGAEQTYTIAEDTEARFRIDADYSLFNNKVYVDNVLVDSSNYTSKSGSTIIVLNKDYVDTLAVGEHTLKVAFADGGEAETTFTIARKAENNNNNENNTPSKPEDKEEMKDNGSNPKTGDNIMLYVAIASMSIIGLVATTIVAKKKKMN